MSSDPVLEAYACGVRLLSGREYCEAEMAARMRQREFDADAIGSAIERLKEDGYLSEARFAEGFLRMRMQRGDTPRLAAIKARQRGVREAELEAALESASQQFDALSRCAELLARRDPAGRRFEDERQWGRQARYLQNKGFDAATILRVMKQRGEAED